MNKHNQDGATNILLLPLIVAVVLFFATLGFGFWAYGQRTNYKDNTDKIVAQAVVVAKKQQDAVNAKQYAEAAKQPLKTYIGPSQFGSLRVMYPKTWSAYVDTSSSNNNGSLSAYFQPDIVPSIDDQNNSFALRISVLNQAYSDVVKGFDGQDGITVVPYSLAKVPKTVGVRITGQIEDNKQGDMVILPLRDTTLEIFTESNTYAADFANNILPNLSFAP